MKFLTRGFFVPIGVFVCVLIFLFGTTLIPPQGKIISGGDLQDQFYYWKSFYAKNILKGEIPFWNPYSFSGTPFLAHPSVAPFYPPNIIFLLLPLHVAFSVYLFFHFFMGGISMYWFCRNITDKWSAFSGGFVFILSGMFAVRVFAGHIDIISTLIWIPLVFGLFKKSLDAPKGKTILLAIVTLTLQILAGYQFLVIQTVILCVFYALAKLLTRNRKKELFKTLVIAVFIILSGFLLSAIQLLPTYQFVQHSIRAGGLPYNLATWGSYAIDTFKLYLNPYVFGNAFPETYSYHGPGPNLHELTYFVGVIPILIIACFFLLQLFIFFKKRKLNKFSFFLFSSLIFYALLSLGYNFGLHRLLYDLLPPFRLFRFPAQYLMISVFILASLTSIALSQIRNTLVKVVITIVIVVELFLFSKPYFRLTTEPIVGFDINLKDRLLNGQNMGRTLFDFAVISGVRKSLDFEATGYYGINSTSGYNPIILANYYRFIDLANGTTFSSINAHNVEIPPLSPYSPYLSFLGINKILVDPTFDPLRFNTPKNITLTDSKPAYKLYENTASLPRYFLVSETNFFQTKDHSEQALSVGVDLSKSIVVNEKYNILPCEEKGEINIISYLLQKVVLNVNAPCDMYLSSSDVFYPGWVAKIDNKKVPIIQSNNAFRALYIPRGVHRVEIYYVPFIYYIGGTISIVTLLCVLLILKKYAKTF